MGVQKPLGERRGRGASMTERCSSGATRVMTMTMGTAEEMATAMIQEARVEMKRRRGLGEEGEDVENETPRAREACGCAACA